MLQTPSASLACQQVASISDVRSSAEAAAYSMHNILTLLLLRCILQADAVHQSVPVWLQLLECCAADPEGQPTALRSLAQQLAEKRALSGQQQQQIAQLQKQVSVQEQLSTEQAARIDVLELQLQVLLQRYPV